MVGYQLHRCDHDRIAQEPRFAWLMCPSCRLLAREPVTTPCDHVFCSSCLKDMYQNEVVVCPVDGKQFRRLEVFPDNFVRREVLVLVVHCIFLDDGCNWKGEVRGLEMHLKECHGHGCASEKSAQETSCEGCNQMQRQIAQLERQLLKAKAEKDEAVRLKEEILDVNHKWDAQYKMVVAAANKEISDLKQQIEVLSSAGSQMRNGPFQLESAGMTNRQPLTSQGLPRGAAALSKGAHTVTSPQDSPSWPGINPRDQQIPPDVIDQIEVLKQQLRVYADDFANEREDRERNQAEKEKMREEFNAMKDQIQNLEQQVEAQRICVESYHDECVTERARAFDDEGVRVSLIQNHMENQQNSLADLRNSHADLQNSLTGLRDQMRRLEGHRDSNN